MKFKTRPHVVEAIRITDPNVGEPGSWLVIDGAKQEVLSNAAFLKTYAPAGRGASKEAYEEAKAEAGGTTAPASASAAVSASAG